jgi:putative nucleotidyltransferase with HDIG domain
MRKNKRELGQNEFSILALDDDPIMTATLKSYFQGVGFQVDTENDPYAAIERVRTGSYDILLLDFLMTPICGDHVVEQIRKFNHDIYIILLTGHKSMAPPIKTIRDLDIQGYFEKSDRFDQLELLVESCVKSIRQMNIIRDYQESTALLVNAMPEIYRLQYMDAIANNIVSTASTLLDCKSVLLVLESPFDENNRLHTYNAGEGIQLPEDNDLHGFLERLESEKTGYPTRLFSALTNEKEQVAGILMIELPSLPTDYQIQLYQLFSRQSSAALCNNNMVEKLRKSYLEMIKAIRLMVDAKDVYTSGHSDRVAYLAYKLAIFMGKDKDFCERVRVAGLFHDIGKLGIPDVILLSDRTLTDEEYRLVKDHPKNGYDILSAISLFKDVAPIVYSHHERIDGRGYPVGLKGEDIPEEARIISIADSFDAMSSARRYRPNMTHQDAISELKRCSGTQFDPVMVEKFIEMIADWEEVEAELAQLSFI